MNSYSHLGDGALLRTLRVTVERDRATTAELLAQIAEVDARRLFRVEGYPSMFAWCVGELHMSEQSAYKRIHAARAARRFPQILTAVAEGRIHLRAVLMLAPRLTRQNAAELIAAATHKTRFELEQALAERFPEPDVPTQVLAIADCPGPQNGAMPEPDSSAKVMASQTELAPERVLLSTSEPAGSAPQPARSAEAPPARLKPLAPQRFALQVTIDQGIHDKLRRAQDLLAHRRPSPDVAQVLGLALDALIEQLERRKFAATGKPRASQRRPRPGSRHVPAAVKRAVRERDGDRCTFVSESGHRCEARSQLEFDHVHEFARGGEATVANLRLRCRAHNQYAAERTFGAGFMDATRRESRRAKSPACTHVANAMPGACATGSFATG